jgi:rhomboid protease GluP
VNWKNFFDRLGMNGTRWQWRMMKWERQLKTIFRAPVHGGGISLIQPIIGLNLLIFAAMIAWGLFFKRGLTPILAPDTQLLIFTGAQFWPLVLQEGEWWRCLTYAFNHGGVIHLAFNMVALFQVGPLIEQEIGRSRFIILYLLTAITATLAGYFWHPLAPVVGASGSLFGLIGFAAAWFHRIGGFSALEMRNFMLKWAAFAFIFGILVGADNAAHLGGAVGGAVLGFVMPLDGWARRRFETFFNILAGAGAAILGLSFVFLVLSWIRQA